MKHFLITLLEIGLMLLLGWVFSDSINRLREDDYVLNAIDGYALVAAPVLIGVILVQGFRRSRALDRAESA